MLPLPPLKPLPALVEKPPGIDAIEASQLAALEPAPWIGFNRRFEPALRPLREAAASRRVFDSSLELFYRRDSWRPIRMRDDALLDKCAGDCMTADPVTVPAHEAATAALALMEGRKITAVLVPDDAGKLVGILHLHDLWRLGQYF